MLLVSRWVQWLLVLLGGLRLVSGSWVLPSIVLVVFVIAVFAAPRRRSDWTRKDFERECRRVERLGERERERLRLMAYDPTVAAKCEQIRDRVTRELDEALVRSQRQRKS
jgi:hypothetical protein